MVEWLPAFTTTSLFALVVWFSRNLIAARLTNAVRHEYDVKIETLRDELGRKQKQIEALRSGALSGVVNRQSVLYQRQVTAVDQVWGGIVQMAPAKNIAKQIAVFKFENTAEAAAENPQLRQIFETMGANFDKNCLLTPEASKSRPFITPMAWAYFAAYQGILGHYVVKMVMLQNGLRDASRLIDHEQIKSIIKTALPHQSDNIDRFGHEMFHLFVDELENYLLRELKSLLEGSRANDENVRQANQILEAVEKLQAQEGESERSA
ncbi:MULTISPECIES: hypothetical protein [unclassified Halorhodospira]|uniref:hypothetical protein n=1 Tax=unclassified Halorhodospira TaxID=2626748 RepID=UPI001EE8BA26|nr:MULTISPECIES: hypothetical protein [unclassified Halorhodospira]MCG5539870.1 hypothetical protein [Halorhodospira sp. M39old]MCG5544679.1 hypothetical protein [Halorhodospira sp. M38]